MNVPLLAELGAKEGENRYVNDGEPRGRRAHTLSLDERSPPGIKAFQQLKLHVTLE
jgi:hypothetical protein